MGDATSASPSAVMVDFERLDSVTAFEPGGLRVYRRMLLWALEVLWAIGPAACHTTNASPARQRLAIGEMTQDAF
jgi:hypothetical protein